MSEGAKPTVADSRPALRGEAPTEPEVDKRQWCLVGNIVEERAYGEGGKETRKGTKHFSSGTKVYCLPALWGDGYDQIVVIGRHRGSKQFRTMIISSKWVVNWRAKAVYDPEVLRRLEAAKEKYCSANWESKDHVDRYVRQLLLDEAREQCKTERTGWLHYLKRLLLGT